MQSYPLDEIHDRQQEVFNQATIEPVLLTGEAQLSYVIMSAHEYQQLIDRLALLEDCALGQLAETAQQNSRMVGTERFAAELKRLVDRAS